MGKEMDEDIGEEMDEEMDEEMGEGMAKEMKKKKLTQSGCKETFGAVPGLNHCICWCSRVGFCTPGNER